MDVARLLRHLFATHAGTRRRFPAEVLQSIETAVAAAERRADAEIRFVIETALDLPELWAGVTPRERALQAFAALGVWDTELRNGVLVHVLLADHDVEIVADRGAARSISQAEWEGVCRLMEGHFRAGRFGEGAVAGIEAVGGLLERHFPARGVKRDELPNQPALL